MKNQQLNLDEYTKNTTAILTWLETVNKNKNNPRSSLQQQLQSLSLSYKNAQEKLLNLQKQVYYECLHNQKQRSIIQILKYIINGNLDDQTILSYLVQIQDESSKQLESKYEIKTELQQIKQIVLKKKGANKKQESMNKVAINDLKKEIAKCNQVKKQLIQDLDKALNEKQKLLSSLQQKDNQIQKQVNIRIQLMQQVESLKKQNANLQADKQLIIQQNRIKQTKQLQYQQVLSKLQQAILVHSKGQTEESSGFASLLKQFKKIENKLQKYRNFSKQLTEKMKNGNKNIQLITSLKLFLPQDALRICEQFQQNQDKFLLKQLEGISRLQKKKLHKLQNCQSQIWRLKSKILKNDESLNKYGKTNFTSSASLRSNNKQNEEPNQKYNMEITDFQQKD